MGEWMRDVQSSIVPPVAQAGRTFGAERAMRLLAIQAQAKSNGYEEMRGVLVALGVCGAPHSGQVEVRIPASG